MLSLLTESDVQTALAEYLRVKRKAAKLSREALAEKSLVPASTIKRFETTGQISLRQLLLLWQSLDDLQRVYDLTQSKATSQKQPTSIEEVLKDGF